jgi:capsular polysaccharide biosynthesis protein
VVRLPPRLRPLFPYLKPAWVRATRTVAPGTQRISRARGGWLPTGAAETLEEAAATSGGRCVTVRPAEHRPRSGMTGIPAGLPLSDDYDGDHFDRLAVAELPNGRVLGPHRAVVSGDGRLVHDVSWYFGTTRPLEHPLFLNPRPAPPLEVGGRLAVLASRGDANYYHFLFDVISRIGVLEQADGVAAPDRWYAPAATTFQRELLAMVGIDGERLVDAARHPHVRAEVLVVPTQPDMKEKNPPWVVQFLRERLLSQVEVGDPKQLLYVTRGAAANNRAVVDEDRLVGHLAERGFTPVDPGSLSVREQIRTFAEAAVIVAPHGAALANLAFASPGAAVVELFPAGCLLPDYWRLADGVPGLRYRYLSAGRRSSRPTRATTIIRDITVDLPALDRLLGELQ